MKKKMHRCVYKFLYFQSVPLMPLYDSSQTLLCMFDSGTAHVIFCFISAAISTVTAVLCEKFGSNFLLIMVCVESEIVS